MSADVHRALGACAQENWEAWTKNYAEAKAERMRRMNANTTSERLRQNWNAGGYDMRRERPKCRDWLASGSCRYGDKCWFQHDIRVECAPFGNDKAAQIENFEVHLSSASSPLRLSECGTLIQVGSSDLREVYIAFDGCSEPVPPPQQIVPWNGFGYKAVNPHQELQLSKNYMRRLLRVLLQKHFPNSAADIVSAMASDPPPEPYNYFGMPPVQQSTKMLFIADLEKIFLTNFDHREFVKAIQGQVICMAKDMQVSDNNWLYRALLDFKTSSNCMKYESNIRVLDFNNLELEIRRLIAIRRIVSQSHSKFAGKQANMFFLRLEPEFLDRLIQCPLSCSMKLKLAMSELEKRCPFEAEIFKFHLQHLNQTSARTEPAASGVSAAVEQSEATGEPCIIKQHHRAVRIPRVQDSKEILSEAVRDPFVRAMAVAGALGPLPVWLQDLPCTSAINEDHPIHVSCRVPTKVYLLAVGPRSAEMVAASAMKWRPAVVKENWAFVPSKHIQPEIHEQIFLNPRAGASEQKIRKTSSEQLEELAWSAHLRKLPLLNFDVFSTVLQPGTHALDTTDAVFFFDTARFMRQKHVQASGAALCSSFQRTGACCEGDLCNYSHVPPLVYHPDIPVYIGYMQLQCRKQLCTNLQIQTADSATRSHMRNRAYTKHLTPSWFPARNRVPFSALLATLVLRLMSPTEACKSGNFKRMRESAARVLPMRIYSGLRLRAAEIDNDSFKFVEHEGYVFRTLFNRPHSAQISYLENGAVFIHGRQMPVDFERQSRELPIGYEICPPDAASIEVCSMYEWSSLFLMLADGHSYSTRWNLDVVQKRHRKMRKKEKSEAAKALKVAQGAQGAGVAAVPQVLPNIRQQFNLQVESRAKMKASGRIVQVDGGDVLIRRRCWSCL